MALLDILKRKEKEKKPESKLKPEPKKQASSSQKKQPVRHAQGKPARAEQAASRRLSGAYTGGELYSHVIKKPRVTEKSSYVTEDGAYTFECIPEATKPQIVRAVKEMYNVTPVKVRTLPVPSKVVVTRGHFGRTATGKKAVVYLKKGERIEFI